MTTRDFRLPPLSALLALALLACHRPARQEDPLVRLLAHTDRMIEILKANRGDPDKARRELADYQARNGAEVERLKRVLGELMQRDPMKVAAFSAVYGLKSAELATLTEQLAGTGGPERPRDGAPPPRSP